MPRDLYGLMRRIHDAQVTRTRMLKRIEQDPTSIKAPILEQKAGDLDLAIQKWLVELEQLEVKG